MGTLILEVHRQTSTSSRMKCNTLDGYIQVQWIMLFNWMIPLTPYQFLNTPDRRSGLQALHCCRQFMPNGILLSYIMNVTLDYLSKSYIR